MGCDALDAAETPSFKEARCETAIDASDTTASDADGEDTDVASETYPESVVVRKVITQVSWEWPEGLPCNQLGVKVGDFIHIWDDSRTDNGWVYAEHTESDRAGWLPIAVLREPPAGCVWMLSAYSHIPLCDRQLAPDEGVVCLVHVESRTTGWVYADAVCASTLDDGEQSNACPLKSGWVPDYCFEFLSAD